MDNLVVMKLLVAAGHVVHNNINIETWGAMILEKGMITPFSRKKTEQNYFYCKKANRSG